MDDKDLDMLAGAIWRRLEQRIGALAPAAAAEPKQPDEESRYAIWKEMTRKVRLAKDVDLRDFARRYPLGQREIMSAVKLMTGPPVVKLPVSKRPLHNAEGLKEAIVQTLGYGVLAARAPLADDKPVECPDDKSYERWGSFCHEKQGEGKGDFSCRGSEEKGKNFTCTGAESAFVCQRSNDPTKFLCDAQPGTKERFACKSVFDCASKDEGPFVCYPVPGSNKGFRCETREEEEDAYNCTHGESAKFACEAKAGFEDKCREYKCGPKQFMCAGREVDFLCLLNRVFDVTE